MSTVHMICGKYYDFENKVNTIGGIQTYISALIPVILNLGMECHIYQQGVEEAEIIVDGALVTSVKSNPKWKDLKRVQKCIDFCMRLFDRDNDILLFTTDNRIVKTGIKKSIAIQHGISWDIPTHTDWSPWKSDLYAFSKVRNTFIKCSNLRKVSRIVCVDHNFANWMRASIAYQSVKLDVIPNFTQIPSRFNKPDGCINIIFARRFEKYRGTRIFAEAAQHILEEFPNTRITFAGSGPDEKWLKQQFVSFQQRVSFITYRSTESIQIHSDKHIAVVPTVGSEGTSLSLLEAMAAQCAVICTDVGGMSNIILDGYNGLYSDRDANSLYEALSKVLMDTQLRERLSNYGYETVRNAFSYKQWEEKWSKVLTEMNTVSY